MGQRLLDKLQAREGQLTFNLGDYIDRHERGEKALDLMARSFGEKRLRRESNLGIKAIQGTGSMLPGNLGMFLKVGGSVGGAVKNNRIKNQTRKNVCKVVRSLTFGRPIDLIGTKERLFLHSYAALAAMGHGHAEAVLPGLMTEVTWGGGKGAIIGYEYQMRDADDQKACVEIAYDLMEYLFGGDDKTYNDYIQDQLEAVKEYLQERVPWLHEEIFFEGARWGRVHVNGSG